jgi:hypothetical protein
LKKKHSTNLSASVRRRKFKASDVSLSEVILRVCHFLMLVMAAIAADFPPSGK